MSKPRAICRTMLLVIAFAINVGAIVVWATRPRFITSGWLALGSADDAPIRLFRDWTRGGQAPWTPLGLASVFGVIDTVIAAALCVVAAVLVALIAMTWSGNAFRPFARLQKRVPWPPSLLIGVRGAMIGIAVLAAGLAWEVNAWKTWQRREANMQTVSASTGGGNAYEANMYLDRARMLRQMIDEGYWSAPSLPNDTRKPEAIEAERAAALEHAKRELAYAERMARTYASRDNNDESAVSDSTPPVEPGPGLPRPAPDIGQWLGHKEYRRALEAVNQEVARDPTLWDAHTQRAWILATCPDPRIRNGRAAVQAALRACELTNWTHADILDTLAAAYAEAGDFTSAVEWETHALELAAPRSAMQSAGTARLALYKAGRPYRLEN